LLLLHPLIDEGDEAVMTNAEIAYRFEQVARLLIEQRANWYRIQAYRRAAETLRTTERPVEEILQQEGEDGLQRLPGIGESLARSIQTLILTGQLPVLEQLQGETDPVTALTSVPGIGAILAERLYHELGVDSLEDLEAAAHDGRLRTVLGLGEKRIAGIIDSLATRLGATRTVGWRTPREAPSVAELLDVDYEYRQKVARDEVPRIAPRRFNPGREPWLPVLHTQREQRYYTVLLSNTAHAHRSGKTQDWVVLYCDDGRGERQWTIVTSQRGPLRGKRIVRGREAECLAYYREHDIPADAMHA
jgi:DNA polymerase (family X)